MWQDYFRRIVVPTIQASNDFYGVNEEDTASSPSRTFFSTDGEDIIIARAYDDDIRELLKSENIWHGRVGAGTTGIHNACDRQKTFREVKKEVRKVLQNGQKMNNRFLEDNIIAAFKNFMNEFPSVEFLPRLRSDYNFGLLVLVHAFDKVMSREMVISGFSCCGQDCKPDENGLTVDFEKMMYQCYTDISVEQLTIMRAKAPILMEYIKLRGTCSLEEFISHGIEPGQTTIDRPSLTHVRHWSEIITHDVVLENYKAEMEAKKPEIIARRKAEATIAKQRQKEARDRERAEATARKKAQSTLQKEEERSRIAHLTAEQRQAEKEAKAAERKRKKDAKEEKERTQAAKFAAEVEEARRFLVACHAEEEV